MVLQSFPIGQQMNHSTSGVYDEHSQTGFGDIACKIRNLLIADANSASYPSWNHSAIRISIFSQKGNGNQDPIYRMQTMSTRQVIIRAQESGCWRLTNFQLSVHQTTSHPAGDLQTLAKASPPQNCRTPKCVPRHFKINNNQPLS